MINQKNRRACYEAIQSHYAGEAGLLAERRGRGCYWSIWSYGDRMLLEVIRDKEKISIYEYINS